MAMAAATSVAGLTTTGPTVQRGTAMATQSSRGACSYNNSEASPSGTCRSLRSEFLPSLQSVNKSRSRKGVQPWTNKTRGVAMVRALASDPEQLRAAREDLKTILREKYCHPILIRLGWHDAGTFDKNVAEFPRRGGANGSLRYSIELDHAANAGLHGAIKLLDPVKEKYPNISYADLFQLASATAIEEAGGPKIPLRYGRKDTTGPEDCVKEGNLPEAGPRSPADHLRKVFYRMGLTDQDIVALSGAHTLGRSRPERSGWGKAETKYTKDGPGAPGGSSWTPEWLKFDNSYFVEIKEKRDSELLVLPTDAVLFEDPEFMKFAEKYAADEKAFFHDYAISHAKLSELGSIFDPPEGFYLDELEKKDDKPEEPEKKDDEPEEPEKEEEKPEVFVAAKYSSQPDTRKDLSDSMKEKIRAEYLAVGGSPDKPLQSNYFLNIILGISALAILSYYLGYLG